MLKLNYTDLGLYMEWVMASPEMLIAQHVVLAMRLAQNLHVEPGQASFLLPTQIAELRQLESVLRDEGVRNTQVFPVDDWFVEIKLSGSWIASSPDAHEGMFVTALSDRTEALIYKLWQLSESPVSAWA
ncbi:hypothetical protein IQ254_10840 [Nodosilinea sp. LEGE 07088]|uniref:alr0857 family protein n=1 Tax=Nodosilinea sp. LEGE 07088 TaxID=2777968 RepID=UPI0018801AEF|nr:alr0857 family protein [Nodosilinea sp. LEGE 07088]MBE9137682.1 hypothetical protein [Nodosilinea sp. LEGE 07088]